MNCDIVSIYRSQRRKIPIPNCICPSIYDIFILKRRKPVNAIRKPARRPILNQSGQVPTYGLERRRDRVLLLCLQLCLHNLCLQLCELLGNVKNRVCIERETFASIFPKRIVDVKKGPKYHVCQSFA